MQSFNMCLFDIDDHYACQALHICSGILQTTSFLQMVIWITTTMLWKISSKLVDNFFSNVAYIDTSTPTQAKNNL